MARQHATPVLLHGGTCTRLTPLGLGSGIGQIDEAALRDLIHAEPSLLPIGEIDRQFIGAMPICTELATDAGYIDLFLVTPDGLPVLVECKLWRNPQARREVIGQILDYAKELGRWTAADVQRQISKRLGRPGNLAYERVRASRPEIDEADFNDALTRNLRRGRFLLLIVGDGIREEMAAIAEYVQEHAGLHFTLGLVEMPIFEGTGGMRFIVPRVLVRTETIVRTVVALPPGTALAEDQATAEERDEPPERRIGRERRNAVRFDFWRAFLDGLILDDPEQQHPRPSRGGNIAFGFGSAWLTVYRDMRANAVGVFLASYRGSPGEEASRRIARHADALREELGPEATIDFSIPKPDISAEFAVNDLEDPDDRATAIAWLRERTNAFINALRPRIRAAAADLES